MIRSQKENVYTRNQQMTILERPIRREDRSGMRCPFSHPAATTRRIAFFFGPPITHLTCQNGINLGLFSSVPQDSCAISTGLLVVEDELTLLNYVKFLEQQQEIGKAQSSSLAVALVAN